MDMSSHSPIPASRLDVQRHYLEDKRAAHAHIPFDAPGLKTRSDQQRARLVPLRTVWAFIRSMLVSVGERMDRRPASQPADHHV